MNKDLKNNQSSITNHRSLVVGWLYPELMNIYGDRGNITTLVKRAEWRGIKTKVLELNPDFDEKLLKTCDILVMGGAQDKQQEIVNKDLLRIKPILSEMIEKGTPGLYVCGGFQFLGNYYKDADDTIIDGLGIFDLHTENPGRKKPRLIGNIAITTNLDNTELTIIGFENHGGRTYLGEKLMPFGKIIKGNGNNDSDETEGAIYKKSIGTYLHGPILPKNPELADFLLKTALEKKYGEFKLEKLDDGMEEKAKKSILGKLSI